MPDNTNNAKNVTTGKPKIGGAVYAAPVGSTVPTSATATLDAAFKCLGYCSEDGLTNDNSPESEDIKAWGGNIVLTAQTEKPDEFTFTLLEIMNADVLKLVYGSQNVSGSLTSGLIVMANSKELDSWAFVVDMVLNGSGKKRIVIPNGKVKEIGTITYKDDEAVGYETTISALPDSSENTHYEYIIQPTGATGASN